MSVDQAGTIEPDPQRLLPPDLRSQWAVVPRDVLYQALLVGGLLGAGIALSIVGFVLDVRALWLAFPVAGLLALLQNKFFPWSERRLLQRLAERQSDLIESDRG